MWPPNWAATLFSGLSLNLVFHVLANECTLRVKQSPKGQLCPLNGRQRPLWRLLRHILPTLAPRSGREPAGARRLGAHLPRVQMPGSAGVTFGKVRLATTYHRFVKLLLESHEVVGATLHNYQIGCSSAGRVAPTGMFNQNT